MAKKKSKDDWRNEFITPGEFKCACGCALQLSKGDLADAIRCALPFGGKPRTYGVKFTPVSQQQERVDTPEPAESAPCPKCGDQVEVPVFAAKLLHDRGAPWPKCASCQAPAKDPHHAREYWE